MKAKEMRLSLKDLKGLYFREKLNRLVSDFPETFKRTRTRKPEKEKAFLDFLLKVTPSAKEILSGEAFRKIICHKIKQNKGN